MTDPRTLIAGVEREIRSADRLLSVAGAARWLALHGKPVHENTVRHWIRVGRLAIVRIQREKRREIAIPISVLERIAACPCCGRADIL